MPIVNTVAFLFTVIGEWWVEGKVISRGKSIVSLPRGSQGQGWDGCADSASSKTQCWGWCCPWEGLPCVFIARTSRAVGARY